MKFIINGQTKLSGEIEVKGAKNSALKIIPASILSDQQITISNAPNIQDVNQSIELLIDLGAEVEREKDYLKINTKNINKVEFNKDLSNKFRASIMFVGPMLAKFGEVKFFHPGGCVIGAGKRPIDLFLDGFKSLGAEIKFKNDYYYLKAKKLNGCNYFFPIISVTATESIIMTAVLAKGTTVLQNCAMEPEIKALADYLNEQGAKINGAGTSTIVIKGVNKIKAGKFKIIPDRIETGSFAIMAVATKSDITISKCDPKHIANLLNIFHKIGVTFQCGNDWIRIKPSVKINPYNIKTHEYPGFPTDLQSPYTVLMTQAQGQALIHETIYDRRLLYVDMLSQMGADIIMCDPHRIVVNGPTQLYGKKLTSPDIRAGIALIIAALIAKGETTIDNIYQIDRGYEDIEGRLRNLGADMQRIV
ncbi:MAG: UDP-N-acetylglucosamine 1-carboxyvinyltransferase [Patescibacteria group bacterium]|nr:UDP-N-acetylglucosamine 1-carboxyvinyltransferase [Patescibacteria group bacterium]MBU1160300.1 UDP-N-acetylglucosamine 1-carboxyvinyltransferase [Patescibacteria group bacterium]MBU1349646.1 UDP-N-acetylglucosamine 1-carboxyvinyltransferase [Patescibacteria group bacterium]MBU1421485.1 UDP-N-acetylglucosamine 1-carboxyvinyltransferase [Patescibacteria group bacterium]MBU1684514.1 UDP-N-acetylglucosamine 1-carboxyvinyltransferase [Patescibacteria group bacterium]